MRRWQLSAFALGTPAKRAKPLSAAVASAALPNIVLPKGDFRRSVCSRIHPPWAPPWCWLGFVCVLAYGTLRHEKCRWGARKKVDRLYVANTTERNPVRKSYVWRTRRRWAHKLGGVIYFLRIRK